MLDYDKPGSSMVEIQCLLDNVGTSELVIDLIVNTKNDRVFEESILLGIALLQGGNTQIQVGVQFSFCFIFLSPLIKMIFFGRLACLFAQLPLLHGLCPVRE